MTAVLACLPLELAACGSADFAGNEQKRPVTQPTASANERVELAATQLRFISLQTVRERTFSPVLEAVGSIDFNEDMSVQVSPPYQGRIVQLLARTGDAVHKGQLLFTIESPDLVQAEATLISSAGTLKLTTAALERARGLRAIQGIADKDYEQAVSDQQAAAGAYQAARDAVRIFGKSDADLDRCVAQRKVDAQMPVPSPINGVVTARNAAPGTLVQPGASPAPYAIADLGSKWLLAQVPEADLPELRLGQALDVRLPAYPDRIFHGRITNISEAVDPNSHRVTVRAEVPDRDDALRPQMFATFTVHVARPINALAVPSEAVVREGDGTFSVWVTTDQRHFQRHTVRIGQQQTGFDQVIDGLSGGEQIAASGALFISNASIQGGAD